jgi:hypothetical protein
MILQHQTFDKLKKRAKIPCILNEEEEEEKEIDDKDIYNISTKD